MRTTSRYSRSERSRSAFGNRRSSERPALSIRGKLLLAAHRHRKALAPLGAAPGDDLPPRLCRHPPAKPMGPKTPPVVGLVGALHPGTPPFPFHDPRDPRQMGNLLRFFSGCQPEFPGPGDATPCRALPFCRSTDRSTDLPDRRPGGRRDLKNHAFRMERFPRTIIPCFPFFRYGSLHSLMGGKQRRGIRPGLGTRIRLLARIIHQSCSTSGCCVRGKWLFHRCG